MSKLLIEVGSHVVVGAAGTAKKGVVAFVGETQFASGEWVGVILAVPEGKNDGSVAGVRYFDCKPNFGLFVKRAQVKIDRSVETKVVGGSLSSDSAVRTLGQPSGSSTDCTISTDQKTTKSSNYLSAKATEDSNPSCTEPKVSSTSRVLEGDKNPNQQPVTCSDDSSHPDVNALKGSITDTGDSELKSCKDRIRQLTAELDARDQQLTERNQEASRMCTETELLEIKIKELESKMKSKEEEQLTVVSKLKLKVDTLTSEISALRESSTRKGLDSAEELKLNKALEDSKLRVNSLEQQLTEALDTLESVTLDKEQATLEMEELEERYITLQRELDKEHQADSTTLSSTDKDDLVRQNERLKEALRRLKAVSAADMKNHEEEMKEALAEAARTALAQQEELLDRHSSEVKQLQEALTKANEEIGELSQVVDANSAVDEMMEKLTAENLRLAQSSEELKTTVKDLEEAAEIMEELDGSQRGELLELRREIENKEAEMSILQSECNMLRMKVDEAGNATDRAMLELQDSRDHCIKLQAMIDEHVEKALSLSERKREERYMRAQRDLLWYSEEFRKFHVIAYRHDMDRNAAEVQRVRYQSMLPDLDHNSTRNLDSRISSELKYVDAEVVIARSLTALSSCFQRCLEGVKKIRASGETDQSIHDAAQKSKMSEEHVVAQKLLLSHTGAFMIRGVSLCWKANALLQNSAIILKDSKDSSHMLQWEDSLCGLKSSLGFLEDMIVGQLLPSLLRIDEFTRGFFEVCDTANFDTWLQEIYSADAAIGPALGKCEERYEAFFLTLTSFGMELELQQQLAEFEASLVSPRLSVVALGLSYIQAEVNDSESVTGPTHQWFLTAIQNILSRLPKVYLSDVIKAGGRKPELPKQLQNAIFSAESALRKLVEQTIAPFMNKIVDDNLSSDLNFDASSSSALSELYNSLQDISGMTLFTDLDSKAYNATINESTLLDINALWKGLKHRDIEENRFMGAWYTRTATVRDKIAALSTADLKLEDALSRADSLVRQNSALGVELQAMKSKLAESLSVLPAVSAIENYNEIESVKGENAVLTEALAVLEKQLAEQKKLVKTKTTNCDNEIVGGSSSIITSVSDTDAVVDLLLTHIRTWRGLACKRILNGLVGHRSSDSLSVLTANLDRQKQGLEHASIRTVRDIYSEARRNRARLKIVSVQKNNTVLRSSESTLPFAPRLDNLSFAAVRILRNNQASEHAAIPMRDTITRVFDETSVNRPNRFQ